MDSRWLLVLTAGLLAAPLIPQDKKDEKAAKPEGAPAAAPPAGGVAKEDIKTLNDKLSYIIGYKTGNDMYRRHVSPDLKLFDVGLHHALSGAKSLFEDAEVMAAFQQFQKEFAEKNKLAGEAFLAENKTKPGVQTLPSGLQYKVIEAGNGPKPKPTDKVTTNYRGTLIDGTEFDSSFARGKPETFQVTQVIKGWTEALQLMPVGSKWQLFIPAALAYGERQRGEHIAPNSTLIFELQLISIADESAEKGAEKGAEKKAEKK
jgi:FKBP-type peptidyl-prolyl cis-trans isomerase FklB